jgi:hypothetical protein
MPSQYVTPLFKKNFISYIFLILIFFLILSITINGWLVSWDYLRIPTLLPAHFDLRFYQYPAFQRFRRDESIAITRNHHEPRHPAAGATDTAGRFRHRRKLDMLLAKKRAGDRKDWLEAKGNQAEF